MECTESIVQFKDVRKIYSEHLFQKKITALDGVSLNLRQGEVLGIIGRNGAGKSTSIKILMGFVRQDSGSILLYGKSPKDAKSHHRIGYLPESPSLYPHLTITDHLKFAAKVSNIDQNKTRELIVQVLCKVKLERAAKIKIKNFSKGMMQRAAIAYALIHNPNLLILDEPMSGLDPFGRQMVVDIIEEYRKKGKSILFCSHILADVERICDRIGIMHHGKIISIIKPDEIPEPTNTESAKSPLEALFIDIVDRNE